MSFRPLVVVCLLLFSWILPSAEDAATGQERTTPAASKGGKPLPEAWSELPASLRNLPLPEWEMPSDLADWKSSRREATRKIVLQCLGDFPARPDPAKANVKVLSREDHEGYVLERFEFHNGIDSLVPGILLIPKGMKGPFPTVIGLHGHGGSAETICTETQNPQCVGPMLARKGFVVAAIDTYFCGARSPKGRGDSPERYRHLDETTLFKLNLWFGRSLWGAMQRDQQCLIDYLETRTEVDATRIGVTGMSMGGTGSWWLAALDDRIRCTVAVAGFTRYRELISHNGARLHGVYYYVPQLLRHFDTEAIYSLIAPRPLLMLSGDQDHGLPVTGIEVLEKKLAGFYELHGKREAFRSVVYERTAHEYLPEMQQAMLAWFEQHLAAGK